MVTVMGIYMVPKSVLRRFYHCTTRWRSGIANLEVLTAKAQKLLALLIAGLLPQSPRHFIRQPSVRVTQTVWPAYLSHVMVAAT